MMIVQLDALSKKVTTLEHENGNLKAKERYNQAMGGGGKGGGAGMGSASAGKKRIELERSVEAFQVEKAVSVLFW